MEGSGRCASPVGSPLIGGNRKNETLSGASLLSKDLRSEDIRRAKTLCLYGREFDDDIVEYVVTQLLPEAQGLIKIEITDTQISAKGMKTLTRAIWTNSPCEKLEELVFHNIHMHYEETTQLKEVIMKNRKHLRRLIIQNCHMNDSAAEPIVQAIGHCESLQEVSFVDNDVTQAVVLPTERGDVFPPSLRLLDLSGNRMEANHFVGLGNAISRCAPTLEELYLAHCCVTTDGLRTLLYSGLYNSSSLSTVNVSSGRLLHTSGPLLRSLLSECPNIQRLYIQDNLIEADGAAHISLGIPCAKRLIVLGLGKCHLGGRGARLIIEAVQQSASLRELDLSGNNIGDEDVHHLCMCNEETPMPLALLDLSENPISENCRSSLQAFMMRHRETPCVVVVRGTTLAGRSSYLDCTDKSWVC